MLDRKQLVNFAKRNAQPSSAAALLAKKKAEAKKIAPSAGLPPGGHAAIDGKLGSADPTTPSVGGGLPKANDPGAPGTNPLDAGGPPPMAHEMVFEAEAEALAGDDEELEDALGSEPAPQGEQAMTPPKWVVDADKWQEAAEAVGLDVPGIEDKFEEPFVVAAYLYKKLGGAVKAEGVPPAPGAEKLGGEGPDKNQA